MRRNVLCILAGIMVLTLGGCVKSPEKSIVQAKNMDKMLQEAKQTDEAGSYEQVREEVKQYGTYQTKIRDKKLKVTVDVDAQIEVPEVDKLSIYRVSAKKIDQSFLDSIRKILTPDITYYDGCKANASTKSMIAKEISHFEKNSKEYEKSEVKSILSRLRKEYKEAPDQVTVTDYPLDNKIQKIQKLYDSDPDNEFYSWMHEMHGKGDVFFGVSDAKDGNYHNLFLHNSKDYGNCLRYDCNKYGYSNNVYSAYVKTDIPSIVPGEAGKEPDFSKAGIYFEPPVPVECVENEPLTLSIEEAEKKVNEFLAQAGLEDYACYEKGMYSQLLESVNESQDTAYYRNIYRFLCLRKLDQVFVSNQAGCKSMDEWQGDVYVQKEWGGEAVAISVNDNGIVDFQYLSPLSIDDTIVEKSNIKSFREIKDTFEQMVVVENALRPAESQDGGDISIKVTDVRLAYTRISEKDSFDTGLIVPVWDFEGTIVDASGDEKTGNILSINAIDGSVINRKLGY